MTSIIKKYGFFGAIKTLYLLISSKIIIKNSYLMHRPLDILGKKFMEIESGFSSGPGLRLEAIPKDNKVKTCLLIGKNCVINDYVHIGAIKSVKIGDNVLMASKIFISDHNHGYYGQNGIHTSPKIIPKKRDLFQADVVIGNNVWIGEFVSILPGSKIGDGCVIGANSVVNSEIPPNSIAVGSPAKVVKSFDKISGEWKRTNF